MLADAIAITLLVTEIFESLGIPYAIGGSLASSLHGAPRATRDADIVADLRPEQIAPFVTLVEEDFYVSADAIATAIQHRISFNLIHWESAFKVDIFLPKRRIFDTALLQRRMPVSLLPGSHVVAFFTSPEDTILAKLEWYRLGDESSTQQWRDVLEMLQVQRDSLDRSYLQSNARSLGVADLLRQALETIE